LCGLVLCLVAAALIERPVTASIAKANPRIPIRPASEMMSKSMYGESLKISIPDEELLDQNGRTVHFYSDLIKGKVVVISFMFTSCRFVCPLQTTSLSNLQQALGERFGSRVHFVSISLDPETDNPKRLKDWALQSGAKPGWTFITGKKTRIDKVVRAFTGGSAEKGEHSPVIYLGNGSTNEWLRLNGLAETERLTELVEQVSGYVNPK
jgi:protein SCO1/2